MRFNPRNLCAPALAAAIAVSLAACGGGAGSSALPSTGGGGTTTPVSGQMGKAQMSVLIPPAAKASSKKGAYVSSSTQSITLSQNGTQLGEADLTSSSPNCATQAGGGRKCTATFSAPVGTNETFQLTMWDQLGGKGNKLSTGNVIATIQAGAVAQVPVTLDGVPTSVASALGTSSLPVGQTGSTTVAIEARDSDGNIIVGPGGFASPITVAISNDTHNTLSLTTTNSGTGQTVQNGTSVMVNSPGEIVTLNYNGHSNVGSTITPSIGNTTGTAASFNATGVSANVFIWDDLTNNYHYYPYMAAALSNGNAAIMFNSLNANGATRYPIGVASPTGGKTMYVGDTSDPYNPPASGSLTIPGMTVVHGMSSTLVDWSGDQTNGMIAGTDGKTVYYAGSFSSTSATALCANSGSMSSGTLGALDTSAGTTVETPLQGYPYYFSMDKNGNIWFLESTGYCNGTPYFSSGWAIGELQAGASKPTETDLGVSLDPYAAVVNAAGTEMYISDGNTGNIAQVPLPGGGSSQTITLNSSNYTYSLGVGSDGTLFWPGYDPYYGYISGSNFSLSNVQELPNPDTDYYYTYGTASADGSFWTAGYEYGSGVQRFSGLAAGTPQISQYANPDAYESGQYQAGMSAGGGYVWALDYEYGRINVFQYGAAGSGANSFASVHRMGMTASLVKNPEADTIRATKAQRHRQLGMRPASR